MKVINRCFILLFVSLLIFDIGGNIILYKILIEFNRSNVKEKIFSQDNKENFCTITLSKKIFDRYFQNSEPDEIEFNGIMYDIKEFSFSGDSVYLNCYKDIRETNFNNIVLDKENTSHKHKQKYLRNIKLLYTLVILPENKINFGNNEICFLLTTIVSYLQFYKAPPSPPPKKYV